MSDGFDFEHEVRRIARAKWPSARLNGGALILGGKERDGVFETEECVHFIEATVSRGKEKASDDAKKLQSAVADQLKRNSMKAAKGWFITKDEPTADQRTVVQQFGKGQVVAVSFAQFQQSLVDVTGYLAARSNYFFGSVLDPATGDRSPKVSYIPLDIVERGTEHLWTASGIADAMLLGKRFVLLGEYGAGKSMTLRQVYLELKKRYDKGGCSNFPVYLNLREHSGQRDPVEVLERHARIIGFDNVASLVRAWRAGYVVFIIDGFDEITTLGAQGLWRKLRENRRRALAAVKKIVDETPKNLGLIIAGREHFFDSESERSLALGLNNDFKTLTLNEFSDEQVGEYLRRAEQNKKLSIPPWLPTKPLLVGYVATRGLADGLQEASALSDSVDGWHLLLNAICEREARIESNLDGPTLRKILERLSTLARSSVDGLGPLSSLQIQQAFTDICGYQPDEQAGLILQRLPGLGVHRAEDESRVFLDRELAEICRARDIQDYIEDPHGSLMTKSWLDAVCPVESFVGISAAARVARNLQSASIGAGQMRHALIAAAGARDTGSLVADLVGVCVAGNFEISEAVYIKDVLFQSCIVELSVDTIDLSKVTYADCYFHQLELDVDVLPSKLPTFSRCLFTQILGRTGPNDLPALQFRDCDAEKFGESALTTNAILSSQLAVGEKVVLTILRKLYMQSLSGRQESALFRGLDHNEKRLVPGALKCLQQQGLATPFNRGAGDVWLPVRKNLDRARRILLSPSTSQDAVLAEAKRLN